MVVVLKLCIGQQFISVVLLLIAEQVKVLFQLLLLGLPIRLGVICCRGVQLHIKEMVQFTGELHNELWLMIRDIHIGETM